MNPQHIKYLCCPECKGSLLLKDELDSTDEIIDSHLICKSNKEHIFPVSNGIPRLLPLSMTSDQSKTVKSFSQKWKTSSLSNYGFEGKILDFHHKWYLQRYGWSSEEDFKSFLSDKSFILDAGCGVGRDVKWFAENTKGLVVGIDISESIDVARENLKEYSNVLLVNADISKLPFKEDFFDFISCDQVIHHTPDTEKTFKSLTKHITKEGFFSVYTYKIKGPIREFCEDFIREKTTKMDYGECYKFSKSITLLGKAFADLKQKVEITEDIPLLGIKKGTYDVQRFIYWHIFKCFWNDDYGMDVSIMTNFDWYHPLHAHRHSPEELKKWIKEENFEILNFDIGDAGLSARLKKQ